MSDFRQVTNDFFVAPQILEEDIALAKADGFTAIIVNRPDGETPDQPESAKLEALAHDAGMSFTRAPISGPPTLADVEVMAEALLTASGKTLAFCRSGTRSITLWSLVQAKNGGMTNDEIIEKAAAAGYDLSGLRTGLESIRQI